MSRCQLNVAIDKAGFLRRIEMVHQPKKVASTVAQIGDCTPELGVEKVAPDFSMPDMNGRVCRLSDCAVERICCSPFS